MATTIEDRSVAFATFTSHDLGEVARVLDARGPTVAVDLEVPIGPDSAVRRTAVVTVGVPEWQGHRFRLPLDVHALNNERWFPTFSGALEADELDLGETRMRLVGSYELPLGAVGRASGRCGGDRLAHASLYALFLTIVANVEREVQGAAPAWRPAPMPESLRDEDRPIRG